MPINSEQVLRKMSKIESAGGQPISHWHQLRRWLLDHEQVASRAGVYCKRCEFLVEYSDMKSWRKDDDTVDMLCPGCDSVLVEGE